MKERPILFSGQMVRAILDGSKTQTRREYKAGNGRIWPNRNDRPGMKQIIRNCPYGQPGDRLWVRETWQHANHPFGPYLPDTPVFYRADYLNDPHGPDGELSPEGKYRVWRPSIHMPRTASRITLEVTGVRVERLQDMEGQAPYPGESSAMAEGVNRIDHGRGDFYFSAFRNQPHPKNWNDPVDAFRELWESINGPGSWDINPWVWVVEFKRINQKEP